MLVITAPPPLAAFFLAPRLKDVLDRLPGIDIELLAESRVADLMRREADIALRFCRPMDPPKDRKSRNQHRPAAASVKYCPE
jgi:DNA-binding transcriptional LysR family regulator